MSRPKDTATLCLYKMQAQDCSFAAAEGERSNKDRPQEEAIIGLWKPLEELFTVNMQGVVTEGLWAED